MSSVTRALLVGAISLGVGCGVFKTPKTPAEQAHAALATEGEKGAWIGHLDGDLAPVHGKEMAFSAQAELGVKFMGLSDGKLCFAMERHVQPGNDNPKEFGEASAEEARKVTYIFEARDALDYPAQASWPARPANHEQSVVLAENRSYSETKTGADGEQHTYKGLLFFRIEVCGPAPKIGPATKFVTVTALGPDATKAPALFIWRIDGSVDSSLVGESPGATTTTPTVADTDTTGGTTGDTTSPSAPGHSHRSHHGHGDKANPSTPSEDLLTLITKDGRFTIFLKLLAASDYAGKLAEGGGTYTLFLPTDDALATVGAGWLKDTKTVNRAVHAHIFGGPKTRAQIVEGASGADGFVKLQNEDGDYTKVTVDNGTIHVGKSSTVVDPELAGSNGVIYVVDRSLY